MRNIKKANKSTLGNTRSAKKLKKKSGRTCKYCGKDPFPNYFYCPACHHKVSSSSDDSYDIKTA